MKYLFILTLLFFCSAVVTAQVNRDSLTEQQNLKVMSRIRNGIVELRWYPTNYAAWRKANSFGYTVKRIDLANPGTSNEAVLLTTVKIFTPEEFRQKLNMNDKMVKGTMDLINDISTAKSTLDRDNEENENFIIFTLATSLSAEAAKAAGLFFNDDKIEKGKDYAYTVSINDNIGKVIKADEALVIVTGTASNYNAPAPQDVTSEQGEGFVKLSWNNTSNKELFSAYNIMRSADKGKTFTRLNPLPYLSLAENADTLYYTDSVQNYIPYQYQIVGYTPWVDLSSPSQTVYGMGQDRTGAAPPTNVKAKGDRSNILLSWDLPKQSKDLKGFTVGRSKNLEGPFAAVNPKLLNVSDRSFTDKKPSPKEPFYAIYSVDTANNLSSTFSVMADIFDSVAPVKPQLLTGIIDTNGVIKLAWKFGNDNDLLGYQIYMANGKNNVYKQITSSPLVDSVIVDTVTMRALNKEVYYKITAVDHNNNASEYSEILVIKRPDIIPPSAPVITGYKVENAKVNITWANSSSTDVLKHALVRINEAGDNQQLAEITDTTTQQFTDSLAIPGNNYTYEIRAYDGAGHVTSSNPLAITVTEINIKNGVERFTVTWDRNDKKAKLQWQFNRKEEYEIVVFRSVDNGEFKAYKKLSAESKSFEENLNKGIYKYALKVIYATGSESALSESAVVEVI